MNSRKITPILEKGESTLGYADIETGNSSRAAFVKPKLKEFDIFLSFSDEQIYKEYRNFQKSSIHWPSLLSGFGFYVFITLMRGSISELFQLGLYFNLAHAVLLFLGCLYGIFFVAHCSLVYRSPTCKLHQLSRYIIFSWINGHFEDVLISFTSLLTGLYLLARVMAGQCPDKVKWFLSQDSCNPNAKDNGLPYDQLLLVQITPLVMQMYFQGVSRWGVLIASLISLAFLGASLVIVNGQCYVFSIAYALFFQHTCYESQRTKGEDFLNSRRISQQESEMLNTEIEHQKQMIEMTNKLSHFETDQLRSIYGNVAHDLKTPIQSISVGIESIRTNFVSTPKETMGRRGSTTMDANTLLDIISASCTFMTMAINRAIDFTKVSDNANLVPTMSTFNVLSEMMLPISCIKCLQSDVSIVIKVASDCLHKTPVISDQHWFCENILCLLSNAVKYSDGGLVTVLVEVQDQPIKVASDSSSGGEDSRASINSTVPPISNLLGSVSKSGLFPMPGIVIGNSSAWTPKGDGHFLVVSVEDGGVGVAAKYSESIFDLGTQGERRTGGTGIGLFSLKQRVTALGGKCGVMQRSDGNQGSLFWFSIPYRPDPLAISVPESPSAAAARTALALSSIPRKSFKSNRSMMPVSHDGWVTQSRQPTPQNWSKHSGASANLKILLVDDSLPILKMIHSTLEKMGHQVITAKNGAKALAEMKKLYGEGGDASELDLVLMDLQMPVMDGLDATRLFREFENSSLSSDSRDSFMNGRSDFSFSGGDDSENMFFAAATSAALAYAGVNHSGSSMVRPSRIKTKVQYFRRRLPIIGMSANCDVGTKEHALGAGMDYFMPKPFSMKEFEAIVNHLRLL